MSKIKIKTNLKNSEENHQFEGQAIKKGDTITYSDNNIITKVKIDDVITIERKEEYYLKLNLKEGIKLKGEYITKYGTFKIETITQKITNTENHLKIIYKLIINDEIIDTYEYNLEYSIDS